MVLFKLLSTFFGQKFFIWIYNPQTSNQNLVSSRFPGSGNQEDYYLAQDMEASRHGQSQFLGSLNEPLPPGVSSSEEPQPPGCDVLPDRFLQRFLLPEAAAPVQDYGVGGYSDPGYHNRNYSPLGWPALGATAPSVPSAGFYQEPGTAYAYSNPMWHHGLAPTTNAPVSLASFRSAVSKTSEAAQVAAKDGEPAKKKNKDETVKNKHQEPVKVEVAEPVKAESEQSTSKSVVNNNSDDDHKRNEPEVKEQLFPPGVVADLQKYLEDLEDPSDSSKAFIGGFLTLSNIFGFYRPILVLY